MSTEKESLKQFAAVLKISEDELEKILKLYDTGQEKLEKMIFDLFKKYGSSDGEQFYKELKKYDRLNKLDKEISEITKRISTSETVILTTLLLALAEDSYLRNIFILENALKTNIKFNLLRKEILETVIDMPVEGLQFSERLYANQLKLKQNVKSVIIDGIVKGQDIKTMSKELNKRMDIGRYNASRICRTETARVYYEGQVKAWEKTNVEKVIYIATLDNRTSEICKSRDGKVYILGQEPKLPAHPNCRSCYGVYVDDFKPSERIDNQTKGFIPYKNYNDWLKDKKK